ncbi:MAG: formate dehydrogenase accessory protein FdhE [Acidobacteria bacterium]|nr:formate dehydrogenase accessory protein FdhE [Acidobacteriota bacterium]
MPYVELSPSDARERRALAEARWSAMLAAKPNLHPAVALQRRLLDVVLDTNEALGSGRAPRLSLPPRYVTTKLAGGIPALAGEPIQPPIALLQPALIALVGALAEGGGGEATRSIRSAIDGGRLDLATLLTLALRREQGLLRAFATKAGLGHDLLWLVCDLATAPFAHALLQTVFGSAQPGSPLRQALDTWTHGYCPLCGSWPAYAEHAGDSAVRTQNAEARTEPPPLTACSWRRLRCSFCAATWELAEGSCVYCATAADRTNTLVPDAARPHRQIQSCGACRGYIKILDEPESLPFPLLAIADLDSMDLDLLAMQHGAARPAIRSFKTRR